MLLELSADLVGNRVHPGDNREIQIITECARKCFRLDEALIQVPHEAIAYSVCVSLEFYTDGDEGRRLLTLDF